ncbi:Raf kinase inhibitor-like YbhB/YbcL family protein [Azospirillum fermentarium]|uniref:YbhB/YbcL family Raf kinase inhibitor-like protein n=1 Tax=Azospirillum fermentarium TaxID=1233114 RepID=UPI0022270437|nr:YbhB/YbcL family Raf kinase inhibitor-like protein [Azospirillum fermentarium]MCW2244846.1 Raf kinase inhibitor-like YbhB/YbcL family protein [Azospirillum fermentarium]
MVPNRIRAGWAAALLLAAAAPAWAGDFTLRSDTIADGAALTKRQEAAVFGCSGQGLSPHLAWSGAPEGTKSFVVSVYDPDAPTGSGFWHWGVINIPASATSLPEGAGNGGVLPPGSVQTRNDAGANGFLGPCPPPGPAHRYVFTVHALKTDRLELDAQASGALVGFMVHMNTLGKASLTATYGR